MAAAFVGQNARASTTAASTTCTAVTTRDIQVGEQVVVCAGEFQSSPGVVASVTVGALALAKDAGGSQTPGAEVWSAPATALIATGATVTVTWTTSTSAGRCFNCISLGGVAPAAYVRGVPTSIQAHASSANPSATSDANPLIGDIAVAFVFVRDPAAGLPTAGAGYTIPANGTVSSAGVGYATAVEYQVLGAAGATTAGFTHTATGLWSEVLVVYKAAASQPSGPRVLAYVTQ